MAIALEQVRKGVYTVTSDPVYRTIDKDRLAEIARTFADAIADNQEGLQQGHGQERRIAERRRRNGRR